MSCYFTNHYPEPSRIWPRFENTYIQNLDVDIEQMRLKSSILQYSNNSCKETKSQRISKLAKGITKTKSYSSISDFEAQKANSSSNFGSALVFKPTSDSDVPGKSMYLVRNVLLQPHLPKIRRKMITSSFKLGG